MIRAVFLDRDGIINKVIIKDEVPFSPRRFEDLNFLDGIKDILAKFKEEGFLNIIVTNQPDISRGLMKKEELQKMHDFIRARLPIDDIFVCPHDDSDNCSCRKPKHGLLLDAAAKWNIDLKNSFFIGDQWKDMEAGKNAECFTILLAYPYNENVHADFRVADLQSVPDVIMSKKWEVSEQSWTIT